MRDALPERAAGGGVQATMTLAAGDIGGMVLETGDGGRPRLVSPDEVMRLFAHTRDFWREWVGRCRYTGGGGRWWNGPPWRSSS